MSIYFSLFYYPRCILSRCSGTVQNVYSQIIELSFKIAGISCLVNALVSLGGVVRKSIDNLEQLKLE